MIDHQYLESLGFQGRAQELQKITRYSMYPCMFYRTNLLMHTLRVQWILHELLPLCKHVLTLDAQKASLLALVHDDAEIITGDVQLGHKLYTLSAAQVAQKEELAKKASIQLSQQWPKDIKGYNYLSLLMEAIHKDSIEAQVVSLADKFDAFGEAWHELYAGNTSFLSNKELPKGVNPVQTFKKIIGEFDTKFPSLKKLFELQHPLFQKEFTSDEYMIAKQGALHTPLRLQQLTGNPHYDLWKNTTLKHGGGFGLQWLTDQTEFLK